LSDPVQLQRDASAGNPKAQFLLSQFCYKQGDLTAMIHWLEEAASSGLMEAIEALGYCCEIGRGVAVQPAGAVEQYDAAIALGSPRAAYRKATLLYKARDAQSNEADIRELLNRAAGQGLAPAQNTIGFLKSVADDHQPENFPLFPPARTIQAEKLSDSPYVCRYPAVLNPVECQHLVRAATPHLQPAGVIDPDGNKAGKQSEVRTNLSTYLSPALVDIIGRYIEMKIVDTTGGNLSLSEPMSILCYSAGEYYRPHYDYFSPGLEVTAKHLADGGQRIASAVTCLNAPAAGGGTSFPALDLTVPAVQGDLLWFRNCDDDGRPDPRSIHAGDPVMEGQKWVVTKWFRESDSGYLSW